MMEYDIHTLLDALTLCATVGVIYALTATPIKNTYQSDLDSVRWYYVVSGLPPPILYNQQVVLLAVAT